MLPPPNGHFFHHKDHVGWHGHIDLPFLHWFHTHFGDVPAPYSTFENLAITPRELIRDQFHTNRSHFIGPATLRRFRHFTDWINPETWPLLTATWGGKTCSLYHRGVAIVPSQSAPTSSPPSHLSSEESSSFWQTAETLGFYGRDTTEGSAPFLIAFNSTTSRQLRNSTMLSFSGDLRHFPTT